ncbi:hypothetical protein NL676_022649 [Syzygium grande]|nr:hypothetical protein NL676_022649 [Syzygium grande]
MRRLCSALEEEEEAEASDEEALLCSAGRRRGPPLRPPAASPLRGHAHDVHILRCGFLLIFSAYGAAQNLESTVNTEFSESISLEFWADNFGTISLGMLHVSFTFFYLVASLAVRSLGPKNAILLGTTGGHISPLLHVLMQKIAAYMKEQLLVPSMENFGECLPVIRLLGI